MALFRYIFTMVKKCYSLKKEIHENPYFLHQVPFVTSECQVSQLYVKSQKTDRVSIFIIYHIIIHHLMLQRNIVLTPRTSSKLDSFWDVPIINCQKFSQEIDEVNSTSNTCEAYVTYFFGITTPDLIKLNQSFQTSVVEDVIVASFCVLSSNLLSYTWSSLCEQRCCEYSERYSLPASGLNQCKWKSFLQVSIL